MWAKQKRTLTPVFSMYCKLLDDFGNNTFQNAKFMISLWKEKTEMLTGKINMLPRQQLVTRTN